MKLGPLIRRDLARSRRRLIVVGAAVAMGVSALVLFGALGAGLYRGIVQPLLPRLPLDLIKVEQKVLSLGVLALDASRLGGGLDAPTLERIRGLEGVAAVYPILGAGFPLRAEGGARFLGTAIRTDLFATGLDPELVRKDVAAGQSFEDPGPDAKVVPVIGARRLIELYNTTVAPAIQRPKLTEEMIVGFSFELVLGSSYVGGTPDPSRVDRVIAQVVGFSDQASLVGITVPSATVRRWNERHAGGKTPIVGAFVKTKSPSDAGPVAAALDRLGLSVDDTMKIVGAVVAGAGVLLLLLALALLGMAGFAIAQTFFLLVGERALELAVLRAMGARRKDLMRLVLSEAGLVGALGGAIGLVLGAGVALLLDRLALTMLPELPFKPVSFVAFPPLLLAGAWALGALASFFGALFPALRAAAADPAGALRT
ncbi:MAG: ABC transporter permease [Deltaproteobacteria bacterium]|nr:ABC transporter permease [Deltaproteobacteria bacterium]